MPNPYRILAATMLTGACLVPAAIAGPVQAAGPAQAAGAAPARDCNSADLRYPFEPGGPRTFGVFGLRIAGGPCATAHRIAKGWMNKFEAAFRAGHLVLPRLVSGFAFATLPAHVAQTFRERGHSRAITIWFEYRIPNG